MVGYIDGIYSNTGSQIEFNAETTSEGHLRGGSAKGPEATATGSIGIEQGGQNVQANSLTYTYAWKRCSGALRSDLGATSATYTPVAADQGKALKVAVTATDSTGSTVAESNASKAVTASLSWYTWDSSLTSWLRPTSTPFTASQNGGYYIGWVSGGVVWSIYCSQGSGSGTLSNTDTQAAIEGYALALTGCTMLEPSGCKLGGNKFTFPSLTAKSPGESSSELKPTLSLQGTGEVVAEYNVEGCGISTAPRKLVGSFPATVDNEGSRILTSFADVQAAGTLHAQTFNGPAVGIASATTVLSEGEDPVKLAIEP